MDLDAIRKVQAVQQGRRFAAGDLHLKDAKRQKSESVGTATRFNELYREESSRRRLFPSEPKISVDFATSEV